MVTVARERVTLTTRTPWIDRRDRGMRATERLNRLTARLTALSQAADEALAELQMEEGSFGFI